MELVLRSNAGGASVLFLGLDGETGNFRAEAPASPDALTKSFDRRCSLTNFHACAAVAPLLALLRFREAPHEPDERFST
eukprot:6201135-Pleurochrysis_carterae.AAC.2